MLARSPLKTPEELGLSPAFYDGMLKVLEKLKSGELVWTQVDNPIPNGFNMGRGWMQDQRGAVPECGTVGCISGWANFLNDKKSRRLEHSYDHMTEAQRDNWRGLVTPDRWSEGNHTVAQAEMALGSYLLTGKADWS